MKFKKLMFKKHIAAIRADTNVGRNTCAMVDECISDTELIEELLEAKIVTPRQAVCWAFQLELDYAEQGTNASSGEPDCQLMENYRRVKALERHYKK